MTTPLPKKGPVLPIGGLRRRRQVMAIFAVLSFLIVIVAGGYRYALYLNDSPDRAGVYRLEIAPGATARDVGAILDREGIVRSAFFFRMAARFTGYDREINAGIHWVSGRKTTLGILGDLRSGGLNIVRVTIPEGYTVDEIAKAAAAGLPFSRADFLSAAHDSAIQAQYRYPATMHSFEGFLYPDTYFFDSHSTPEDVIHTLARRFESVFTPAMEARADSMNMSVREVVTLASIIEREAVVERERAIISQVFHKRLRIRMPLGADPTVKYALRKTNRQRRRLSLRDIEIDSPYNTYRRVGLPPGPICNPSVNSLKAALRPAKTDYLYFVANWDGTHTFSRTLREHNNAKIVSSRRYLELREAAAQQSGL